jgi:hypothetical protein
MTHCTTPATATWAAASPSRCSRRRSRTTPIVKVLDFGLAKIVPVDERPASDQRDSHVATFEATRDGLILGTVPYMSPEQARGQAVDGRTDIWAFGCILFEMLTGRMAFLGQTAPDTMAAILDRDPDWSALPADAPDSVRRLLSRCLEKSVKVRLRDIANARPDLTIEPDIAPAPAPVAWRPYGLVLMAFAAGVLGAAAAGAALWRNTVEPTRPAQTFRFSVAPPAGGVFVREPPTSFLALSPRWRLAFSATDADGRMRIWLRGMSDLEPQPSPGRKEDDRRSGRPMGRRWRSLPAGN